MKAFNQRRKNHGNDHIEVAQALHALGKMCLALGDIQSAVTKFSLSLAITKKFLMIMS